MRNKTNRIIIIMLCICAIALCGMLITLACSGKTIVQSFSPPPFEEDTAQGIPNVPDSAGWSKLNADSFCVGICGKVTVAGNSAEVWLTNPEDNTVWLKLRILDEHGSILGETGLLTPGQYVQTISLSTVPATGTSIVLKVMAYEPETYHSAGSISLNTSIYWKEAGECISCLSSCTSLGPNERAFADPCHSGDLAIGQIYTSQFVNTVGLEDIFAYSENRISDLLTKNK